MHFDDKVFTKQWGVYLVFTFSEIQAYYILHRFELNNIHSEMEYFCKSVGIVLYIFYADGSIIYVSK